MPWSYSIVSVHIEPSSKRKWPKTFFPGTAFIKAPCSSPGHCRISSHRSSPGHAWYGILWYLMIPLHGIACFCDIGFGARAVSRKTPIFFIVSNYIAQYCTLLRCWLRRAGCVSQDAFILHIYIIYYIICVNISGSNWWHLTTDFQLRNCLSSIFQYFMRTR